MNFDEAKENIQPLATGRNASVLQASLSMESPQEIVAKRRELENEIHNYVGDDPLSAWYNYIDWIEQSFPSGGKESGLKQVLAKCLDSFASDERYYQDGRMIRLFIKYVSFSTILKVQFVQYRVINIEIYRSAISNGYSFQSTKLLNALWSILWSFSVSLK